ncbi:hypothetical protein BC834DRAFT_800086, partial [Gloeopeniophorella convolvens]
DQRRAYDIIADHMRDLQSDVETPQLLMQIQGEGGTGKSKVIQLVTDLFETSKRSRELVRAAYTGIAASLINGKTIHA